MYNKKYSGGFQRKPNNNSFGRFNRNRFGSKKLRFGATHIDPALFVKKAEEFITIEETLTVNSFADFKFHQGLMSNIKAKGYLKPTKIQDEAIPHIIAGRDVLGIANTGTGKTAAFALPLINKILNNPTERILIMSPTRELAIQIQQEFRSFIPGLRIYMALAIGGANIRRQITDIRRGPHIIIGTPGRIKDLGQRGVINYKGMTTLVLDEVDRMLDMGFIDDIKFIVNQTPSTRHTLFFSATVKKREEMLTAAFLNNPIKVSVETPDASSHVEQNVVRVPRNDKERKLCQLVSLEEFKKVLIFGSTQMIVEKLTDSLIKKGFHALGLHGGKRQSQRQSIVRSFRENEVNILVATDVAARGLDIADITHVINFDQPNNYEEYIHRVGRTGRGNSKGFALTFID